MALCIPIHDLRVRLQYNLSQKCLEDLSHQKIRTENMNEKPKTSSHVSME